MAEGTVEKPLVNRRRIIERPRLTRLLDDSPARIKMLVAPAGYGKTTLARQWVHASSSRRVGWMTCSPACRDVQVLAEGLAAAIGAVGGRRIDTDRLIGVSNAEVRAADAVDLLADAIGAWPSDHWLVLDDYHETMDSEAAEAVLTELVLRTRVSILLASRRRPTWATARSLFYEDIFELSEKDLEMTEAEVRDVLIARGTRATQAVVQTAGGWPAFVALAGSVDVGALQPRSREGDVYDYVVTELLAGVDGATREALCDLSLAPRDHGRLLSRLHSHAAYQHIASEGVRIGILSSGLEGELELHPLVQECLRTHCIHAGEERVERAFGRLWKVLHDDKRWEDMFELLVAARRADSLPSLLRLSTDELISSGRVATLRRWLAYAHERSVSGPVILLVEAKLAMRSGLPGRARVRAEEAAQAFESADDRATAWCLAGLAAHLQGEDEVALQLYREAADASPNEELQRRVRWGTFIASLDAESEGTADVLREIINDHRPDPTSVADRWNAQLLYEIREAGVTSLHDARIAVEVIDLVTDAVRRTAFRSVYSSALGFAAEYGAARDEAAAFLADVQDSRLEFALPYAHASLGVALTGLRLFDEAAVSARQAVYEGERLHDAHGRTNGRAVMARVLLARGAYAEAADQLETDVRSGLTRGMIAESHGWKALCLACLGDAGSAQSIADARSTSGNIETIVLTRLAEAVYASVVGRGDATELATRAIDVAFGYNALDLLVGAYRGHPELLVALRDEPARLDRVRRLLEKVGDHQIARLLGIGQTKRGAQLLSPRETEIHALVALGLTNKEIAQRLFISEATAKLHVHHILEKLNVRTRTAAAARYGEGTLEDLRDEKDG